MPGVGGSREEEEEEEEEERAVRRGKLQVALFIRMSCWLEFGPCSVLSLSRPNIAPPTPRQAKQNG